MSKEKKEFTTNYRQAWLSYTLTEDYKRSEAAMIQKGMNQPYIDNILMLAFAAGWNATGAEIKIVN